MTMSFQNSGYNMRFLQLRLALGSANGSSYPPPPPPPLFKPRGSEGTVCNGPIASVQIKYLITSARTCIMYTYVHIYS